MSQLGILVIIVIIVVVIIICVSLRNATGISSDCIVGVWSGTTDFGVDVATTATFNADGTFQLSSTGLMSQADIGGRPEGLYGSQGHGCWKRTSQTHYKLKHTDLLNGKDTSKECCPGIPFSRVVIDSELVISSDCKSATWSGTSTFYAPFDLTFTQKLFETPFTGEFVLLCSNGNP